LVVFFKSGKNNIVINHDYFYVSPPIIIERSL